MINKRYKIALVSDYFYPNLGGIETHIELLAKNLIKLNCHVIIITHKYTKPSIKVLNGIKVFYLNIPIIAVNTTFPNLLSNFKVLRDIFIKEKIEIVHGHQSMSNLALEAVFHAKTMNLKTVFTEHSVFETGGFENVIVNRLCELILRNTDKFICVSYTLKENFMKRIKLKSEKVYVIPNAVVKKNFYPKKKKRNEKYQICNLCESTDKNNKVNVNRRIKKKNYNINNFKYVDRRKLKQILIMKINRKYIFKDQLFHKQKKKNSINVKKLIFKLNLFLKNKKKKFFDINCIQCIEKTNVKQIYNVKKKKIKIIVMSRLVSRKGIDILIKVIPEICLISKKIKFIIAGDGPKRDELEQMIDNCDLKKKVKLIGEIEHQKVGNFLRTGDIFLNVSLTEAFCMAILEAAACGLKIVSTNVGGICEVLPSEIITLTSIDNLLIINGLKKCINDIEISNDESNLKDRKSHISLHKIKKKFTEKLLLKYKNKEFNKAMKKMYTWRNIAKETIKVYDSIENAETNINERMLSYHWFFEFFCRIYIFLEYLLYFLLQKKS